MVSARTLSARPRLRWWPVVAAYIVALAGYFGAWIWNPAAGLVVTGVDLAEVVKFLPAVRAGQISVLRESFYAPLAAGSLMAGLLASRRSLSPWLRWLAGLGAIPLALAMLPPAWSPAVLALPEFRIQVVMIVVCSLALPLLLVIRFLPDSLILSVASLLALIAAIWPASSFLPLLGPIAVLYRAPLDPGWGFYLSTFGFLMTVFLAIHNVFSRPLRRQ